MRWIRLHTQLLLLLIVTGKVVLEQTTNKASFFAIGFSPPTRFCRSIRRNTADGGDEKSSVSLLFSYPQNKNNPRSSSSSSPTQRRGTGNSNRPRNGSNGSSSSSSFAVSKEINGRLIEAGKKFDWIRILHIYKKEKANFSHVNYATSMSQLGRIRSLRKDDERFEDLMLDIAAQIQNSATRSSWEARQMANVLHAVAKMKWKSKGASAIVKTILQEDNVHVIVTQGEPQNIANTAWACATLGVQSPALFAAVDEGASYLVGHGKPQEIANTAWACATLGVQCPAFFTAIDDRASYIVEEGNGQHIANTAWACATLGVQCPAFFTAIVERASYLVEEGKPQEIANTALGVQSPALFTAIDDRASFLVEEGTPQAIANTAWACATSGVQCPDLFTGIDNRASFLVQEGTPQNIANTAWACATLGVQCPALFTAINERASFLVQQGTPQNIANTAWACATLGVQSPALFTAIDDRASFLVQQGDPQAIANTAWACATLGVQCPALFTAVDERASYLVEQGNGQAIAITAWAFAQLGRRSTDFFDVLSSRMPSILELTDVQAITIICHSFAILDLAQQYETEFRLLWNRALLLDGDELNGEHSHQLFQTYIIVSRVLELPPPDEVLKAARFLKNIDIADSRSQREMSALLEELGFAHQIEASPFPDRPFVPGLLAIDAACKDRMIAIEFDGPSHFLRDVKKDADGVEGRIENGPTQAKRRFLERLGWKVVNVPWWEWRGATRKDQKKKLLAKKILATARDDVV